MVIVSSTHIFKMFNVFPHYHVIQINSHENIKDELVTRAGENVNNVK